MTQMGFLLDQKYCIGCQCCVVACNTRHGLMPTVYPRQASSYQIECGGPYISVSCNHCDNPACVDVCPTGAVQKRDDGIVVHDPEVCIGCYSCEAACPYGAPHENEINNRMVKCDMCAARLDKDEEPACVMACPMKVLTVGAIEDLEAAGGVAEGVGFTVESTGPNIRFIPVA